EDGGATREPPERAAEEPRRRSRAAHVGEESLERPPEQGIVEAQLEKLRRGYFENVDDGRRFFFLDDDGRVVIDEHEVVFVVTNDASRDLVDHRRRELAMRRLAEKKLREQALRAHVAL